MHSLSKKLILVAAIGLIVNAALIQFITIKYDSFLVSSIRLSNQTSEIQNSAFKAQIYFKTQIQEWKNILLRGSDKQLYNKYFKSFVVNEDKTKQEVEKLLILAKKHPELINNITKFIVEHKNLSLMYREALSVYNNTKSNPQIAADLHVRGIDREPILLLSNIVNNSHKILDDKLNMTQENLIEVKRVVMLSYIITLALLTIFFWLAIKKGVYQPLNRTIKKANLLARSDALTGVANRHAYNEKISTEIKRFNTLNIPFTFLLLDIDHFKSINDSYGHESGDQALKEIGVLLTENIRDIDFIARYGGEEFVILLSETNINTAEKVANKLRELIENKEFNFNKKIVQVTISIGFSEIKLNETKKEIFERTDAALYKAKELGRNKCIKSDDYNTY